MIVTVNTTLLKDRIDKLLGLFPDEVHHGLFMGREFSCALVESLDGLFSLHTPDAVNNSKGLSEVFVSIFVTHNDQEQGGVNFISFDSLDAGVEDSSLILSSVLKVDEQTTYTTDFMELLLSQTTGIFDKFYTGASTQPNNLTPYIATSVLVESDTRPNETDLYFVMVIDVADWDYTFGGSCGLPFNLRKIHYSQAFDPSNFSTDTTELVTELGNVFSGIIGNCIYHREYPVV